MRQASFMGAAPTAIGDFVTPSKILSTTHHAHESNRGNKNGSDSKRTEIKMKALAKRLQQNLHNQSPRPKQRQL